MKTKRSRQTKPTKLNPKIFGVGYMNQDIKKKLHLVVKKDQTFQKEHQFKYVVSKNEITFHHNACIQMPRARPASQKHKLLKKSTKKQSERRV